MQGEQDGVVEALSRCDLAAAPLDEPHRALLQFVELVTRHAYRTTPEDVERLRAVGWTDEQVAEAVYVTALFAFFNRVADAFGLTDPGYLEMLKRGGPESARQAGAPVD